jgi:TOTE conflict system, Archaeo-Eukaryotic Primase domain
MLLTEAMARSTTLGMASYDRLFPSQDTLPNGGFGNLIALPLQRKAREQGNTVFVDEQLEPFADQWSYLESLPRIPPARVRQLVDTGVRDGRVLGANEDDTTLPWRPVRPLTDRLAGARLPRSVSGTLAQCVYVREEDLPPVLVDALRRLAVFSNPRFLELQAMRMSTARTPRVIACFEHTDGFLVLPRGCRQALEDQLEGLGVTLDLSDERTTGEPLDTRFAGRLTATQEQAASALLSNDLGVLCAPPGVGKTVIAAG